jgi:Glycosyl transferases group 1
VAAMQHNGLGCQPGNPQDSQGPQCDRQWWWTRTIMTSKPKVANIVGWDNGGGLSRDIDLLSAALHDLGWRTAFYGRRTRRRPVTLPARALSRVGRDIRRTAASAGLVRPPYDCNLHLQGIYEGKFLPLARRNMLIPNQEWFGESRLLPAIDEVWAKTRVAEQVFAGMGCRARFLGWTGADRKLAGRPIPKTLGALHIAGSSEQKGTEAVLDVWSRHPAWPLLRVLRRNHDYLGRPIAWPRRACYPNIQILSDRVDEDSLIQLQNETAIHLCPSEAEGFGHSIVEGMSVGALIITTDAPPMNEIITGANGLLVEAERSEAMGLGRRYFVSPDDLARKIAQALAMSEQERNSVGQVARAWFDANDSAFRARLAEFASLVTEAAQVRNWTGQVSSAGESNRLAR